MCPDVRAVSTVRRPVEISVVLPVYKCGECVAEMHSQLVAALEPLAPSFEIVFVNDGCPAIPGRPSKTRPPATTGSKPSIFRVISASITPSPPGSTTAPETGLW